MGLSLFYDLYFIGLAGHPTATQSAGMSFITTAPAPIVVFAPMETRLIIDEFVPM